MEMQPTGLSLWLQREFVGKSLQYPGVIIHCDEAELGLNCFSEVHLYKPEHLHL